MQERKKNAHRETSNDHFMCSNLLALAKRTRNVSNIFIFTIKIWGSSRSLSFLFVAKLTLSCVSSLFFFGIFALAPFVCKTATFDVEKCVCDFSHLEMKYLLEVSFACTRGGGGGEKMPTECERGKQPRCR